MMSPKGPEMTTANTTDQVPTMKMLRERRREILSAAAKHGASNLRVYGSVVRDAARADSDIDLLVDMEEGRSLLDLAALHIELEELLGFPVEIGTDVKPRLRERVHAEAIAL
jgi:predicted nucleotidyltransferase